MSARSGILLIVLAAALIGPTATGADSIPAHAGAPGAPSMFNTGPAGDLAELSKEPPTADPTMTGDAAVETAPSEVRGSPLQPAPITLASQPGRASGPEIRKGHDSRADERPAPRLGVGFCAHLSGCQAAFDYAAGPLYRLLRVYRI